MSQDAAVFTGFEAHELETQRGAVHALVGGSGPPVLLLHGYPQSHLMWHAVAPLLAQRHTVVAADLAGYGDSFHPAPTADHTALGKRAMAPPLPFSFIGGPLSGADIAIVDAPPLPTSKSECKNGG